MTINFTLHNKINDSGQNKMKKIGIIGGAGPMASCQLYREVITEFQRYGCKNDRDFPEIIIISFPFSGMLNAQEYKSNQCILINELQYCFDWLYKQNVDIAVIACNTLHALLSQITIRVPTFVSLPNLVIGHAIIMKVQKLLILGTEITNQMKLYTSELVECISPNETDQMVINTIINNILAGNINKEDAKKIVFLINQYKKSAAIDGVVLACTELPLLYQQYKDAIFNHLEQVTIFDSIAITAQSIVKVEFEDLNK